MVSSPTSNGLQQANDLVRSIHQQITCADAPINNPSDIQSLIRRNDNKLQPTPEQVHDNLSSTASEHSYNSSSIGPTHASKMPTMLPPRPPRESNPIHNLEDMAAVLTGTVSLANLCRRTEESMSSGLDSSNGHASSFPTLPPLDGEIRPFDPTPRRCNVGFSAGEKNGVHVPQSDEPLTNMECNNNCEESHEQSKSNSYFDKNVGDFTQFKEQQLHKKSTPNKASETTTTSQPKPRMQMFASEYARILSSSKHNPASITNPHRPRLPPNMGVSSKLKAKLSRTDDTIPGTTLDDCPSNVSSAAITDLLVTSGSDPPPRGYYRVFPLDSPEKAVVVPTRKRKRLYLNAKKEVNWDRAVQRPCVTAICVIYPDRNEFVPPGFSVVRLLGGGQQATASKEMDVESSFGAASIPANINPSSSGERVYLCYRRSREGNPITGILCLKPNRGDVIPEGYTVLERTPRNFVADMSAKTCDPMFLAFRQRLENLECLRPLPLVLAVLHSRSDVGGRKELRAYYCTGGTTVASDVGNLHIMDRSTHNLLSSSSAQSRLTLIQLSRKESGSAVPNWASSASSHSSFQSNPQRQSKANYFESPRTSCEDGSTTSSNVYTEPDTKCDSTSISTFETPIESTITRSPSHESVSSYGTALTSQSSPAMSFKRTTPRFNNLFSHSDDTLQACFDAMSFIPSIECARSTRVEDSSFLQSRVTVVTPILTACYTSQGGSALVAVEGLTSLLNESLFFEPDVVPDDEKDNFDVESSTRLTLLDLTIQVVCDVATSSARETYFRSCVDFVSDAVRYARGKLNDRTVGFVLRFYLFVFYFGASIPSSGWPFDKEWNEKTGMMGDLLLSDDIESFTKDKQSLIGVYLPGGAPQAAAIALKELVVIMLGRLGAGMRCQAERSMGELSNAESVARQIVSQLVESAMNKVDVANLTQLASYQIHRSGGSELFWHDMINSCGHGLFGEDTLSSPGVAHANIISFAILTSFVKISSGKVRVISNNSEPVPRDVASKLLSLELLLAFIQTWHDSIHVEHNEDNMSIGSSSSVPLLLSDDGNSAATMVYVMRRLIIPTLLSNTSSALEDCRVFRRVLRIISTFWSNPYYRSQMKVDLAVLMEHFVLRALCMGPQVSRTVNGIAPEEGEESNISDDMPSLLNHQLDVLSSMNDWFSSDHTQVIDFYLKFDLGHDGSLPLTYSNICTKIVEALCNLAEQCGAIICEHGRFTSINGVNSSPRKSISPRACDMSDMAHVRETAQLLRDKSFQVITLISKSMMRCASIKQNPSSPVKSMIALERDTDQLVSFGMSPQLSPAPDARSFDDNNIIDYWHTSIERRKAPLQPIFHQLSNHSNESDSSQSIGIKNSRSEDSSKYSISQHKKEALDIAFDLIATKGLKKGLDYLIASHLLTSSPRDVSSFLRIHQSSIDPEILGEYLGEGGIDGSDKDYWNHIRFNYARAVSFVGMNIEQGLRHFLTGCGFKLPGEAQKIDRIISTFSQCYWEDNAGDLLKCPYPDQDTVFLVSFAIIMLNTDLHKASIGPRGRVPKKMSRNEFIANLRHVYSSVDKFRAQLIAIYDSIEANPIAIGRSTQKNTRFEHTSPSLPFRDDDDFATSIQSWVRGVKQAQELLRTVAVRYDEVTMSSEGELHDESTVLELTYEMFSSTWHLFHGVINTTVDNAYIDLAGLDCCIDLLEYSLCTATFLDMSLERSAFSKMLGRVNRFNELKVNKDESESAIHNSTKEVASQIGFDELNDIRCLSQRLHTSLYVDDSKVDAMKQVAARIRNGEILLNDPSRTFVREGNLTKKHQLAGRSSTYRFFLFSDVLVYAHKSAQGDYKVHEELPLHLMKIEDYESPATNKARKSSFHIHHPNKSFLVVASNPSEKQWWVDDITDSIKKEVKRKARIEGARKAAAASEM